MNITMRVLPVVVAAAMPHTWLNWRNYLIEFTPQLF